jgi:hypothetical protein
MVVVQVGATDAAIGHSHAHLARHQRPVGQGVDAQVFLSVADGGKHCSVSSAITVTKALRHG